MFFFDGKNKKLFKIGVNLSVMKISKANRFYIILLFFIFILGCNDDPEVAYPNTVSVIDFGAIPNDEIDDTQFIQNAIDSVAVRGGGLVVIPKGTYKIDAIKTVNLKSNITLKLDSETKLFANPNGSAFYNIISIEMVENVKIIGGQIQGERYERTGTKGEWGMGIGIYGGKNVSIKDVIIKDCWGDGIYVGYRDKPAQNVNIENVKCIGNRRQGMSITSAHNVTVVNSEFSETQGTNPQAGIDIEPNKGDTVSQVTIKNCVFENNKLSGVQVGANSNTLIADILVTQSYFDGNRWSAYIAGGRDEIRLRKISFIDNIFKGNIYTDGVCFDCMLDYKSN